MIGDTVQTSIGEGVVVAVAKDSVCLRMEGEGDLPAFLSVFDKSAIIKLHSACPLLNNLHINVGQEKYCTIAVKLGVDSINIEGVTNIDIRHDAGEFPITTLTIHGYPNVDYYPLGD